MSDKEPSFIISVDNLFKNFDKKEVKVRVCDEL